MFGFSWGVEVRVSVGSDYPYLGHIQPLNRIFTLILGRSTATSAITPKIHNSQTTKHISMKFWHNPQDIYPRCLVGHLHPLVMLPRQHDTVVQYLGYAKPAQCPAHMYNHTCIVTPPYTYQLVPRGMGCTRASSDAQVPHQQHTSPIGTHPPNPRGHATWQVRPHMTWQHCHHTHVASWVVADMSATCCHVSSMLPGQWW